jgi:hypothetical protein
VGFECGEDLEIGPCDLAGGRQRGESLGAYLGCVRHVAARFDLVGDLLEAGRRACRVVVS